jgi:hypothetical protein
MENFPNTPSPPSDKNFVNFTRKIFSYKVGQNGQISFCPTNFFAPVRLCVHVKGPHRPDAIRHRDANFQFSMTFKFSIFLYVFQIFGTT